jgi:hypothetical protein
MVDVEVGAGCHRIEREVSIQAVVQDGRAK